MLTVSTLSYCTILFFDLRHHRHYYPAGGACPGMGRTLEHIEGLHPAMGVRRIPFRRYRPGSDKFIHPLRDGDPPEGMHAHRAHTLHPVQGTHRQRQRVRYPLRTYSGWQSVHVLSLFLIMGLPGACDAFLQLTYCITAKRPLRIQSMCPYKTP